VHPEPLIWPGAASSSTAIGFPACTAISPCWLRV